MLKLKEWCVRVSTVTKIVKSHLSILDDMQQALDGMDNSVGVRLPQPEELFKGRQPAFIQRH